MAARRAHNPEAVGSSPTPAIRLKERSVSEITETLFYFNRYSCSGGRTRSGVSGPKKGEQCAAFFWKAGREASLANEGAVEEAAKEGGDRNGESCPPHKILLHLCSFDVATGTRLYSVSKNWI